VSATFDRVRHRAGTATTAPRLADAEGKRALFSPAALPAAPAARFGAVSLRCGRCGAVTVLGGLAAARALLPSLVLGVRVRRGARERAVGLAGGRCAFARCPACRRFSWSALSVRV
jgi:hypothetical protein